MELGTGVFLGALVVSVTLLIIFSRQHIKWGRIFKWILVTIVLVITITIAIVYYFNTYAFHRTQVNMLDGVSLGEKIDDVRFRKGEYSQLCYADGTKNRIFYTFPAASEYPKTTLFVEAWDGLVERIIISGDLGYASPSPSNAIYEGTSEERIREIWGTEDFIRVLSPSTRLYVYRRYHFAISVANNKAGGIIVFNPGNFYAPQSKATYRNFVCFDKDGKQVKD